MRDNPDQHGPDGNDNAPMTLLAVNQGYWLYEGEDLLNDLLFARGLYPFRVRCLQFDSTFELNRYTQGGVSVANLWRINSDVIERLRRDDLLIEIFPTDF